MKHAYDLKTGSIFTLHNKDNNIYCVLSLESDKTGIYYECYCVKSFRRYYYTQRYLIRNNMKRIE